MFTTNIVNRESTQHMISLLVNQNFTNLNLIFESMVVKFKYLLELILKKYFETQKNYEKITGSSQIKVSYWEKFQASRISGLRACTLTFLCPRVWIAK